MFIYLKKAMSEVTGFPETPSSINSGLNQSKEDKPLGCQMALIKEECAK